MKVYEAWIAFEFTIHRPPLRQFIGDQPLRPPVGLGQYASVCYTGRISELGVSVSIGTVGDSYDNAMAESVMGIFKTELHRNPAVLADNVGHWKGLDDLAIAICAWASWFSEECIHSEPGDRIPCKIEEDYSRELQATAP